MNAGDYQLWLQALWQNCVETDDMTEEYAFYMQWHTEITYADWTAD